MIEVSAPMFGQSSSVKIVLLAGFSYSPQRSNTATPNP